MKHYCLYISISRDNPYYGLNYDIIPNATYANNDDEIIDRWVFGWDYAHHNMLNLSNIFFYHYDSDRLLDMQIIDKDIIDRDVSRYIAFLAGQ